jgi:hypothetical protein
MKIRMDSEKKDTNEVEARTRREAETEDPKPP